MRNLTGSLKGNEAGFTPIELLVVLALVAMLSALPLSLQRQIKSRREQAICLANLERIGQAMQMYTEDFSDTFPGHRNTGALSDSAEISRTNWWGTTIFDYTGNQSNLFRCPVLKGMRKEDNGANWEWKFDCHQVGYGMNAYFLGIHPYPGSSLTVGGIRFDTTAWFKRSGIVKPSDTLVVAEKQPYSSPPVWSSSLWWPNANMVKGSAYEGVSTSRHASTGTVSFSDGHCEFRRNQQINPPIDPSNGSAKGLINSRYWDPLQRGGLK